MNRKLAIAMSIGLVAGIAAAEFCCRSIACRDWVGRVFGRGQLLAIVAGSGIYEEDVDLAVRQFQFRNGEGQQHPIDSKTRESALHQIANGFAARSAAAVEKISSADVQRELDLSAAQFRDHKTWLATLQADDLSPRRLRRDIIGNLKTQRWIEKRLQPQVAVSEHECRQWYDDHPKDYMLPLRIRASHLFLAAPTATPLEIVDLKKKKIEDLSKRISAGQDFVQLTAIESEDEATKSRGGDLSFFSVSRMPADFFSAVQKLKLNEISKPIQTALGFHIVRVTEIEPARQMTFEEARPEIHSLLLAKKSRSSLRQLDVDLADRARTVAFTHQL